MGGGLMQLVAYGAQDIYLTGNPQITFLRLSTADTLTFLWRLLSSTFNGSTAPNQATATISKKW